MQEERTAEIESAGPKYLIFVQIPMSWLAWAKSHRSIFSWFESYQRKHYELVGIVDLISPTRTNYRWDEAVHGYKPQSKRLVYVFRRKVM